MITDTLFLLPAGFTETDRREYCPECAEMYGLLAYYPSIKNSLNIVYVDIHKPRQEMTALLGDTNQNAPTLLLHPESPVFEDCGIQTHHEKRFINNARDIGAYYARRFGTAWPRGH